MLPRIPPEWVWRPGLEKVASRTLPEPPSCAEIIAPAILFTLPRGCPQDRFGLHFGSILAPFWAPWAPKSRPRGEKEAFPKSIKKIHLFWGFLGGLLGVSWRVGGFDLFAPFSLPGPSFAPDGAQIPFWPHFLAFWPHFANKDQENQQKFSRELLFSTRLDSIRLDSIRLDST